MEFINFDWVTNASWTECGPALSMEREKPLNPEGT